MSRYQLPPDPIVRALDTPPAPATVLSPDRSRLLLVAYEPYPPVASLARPFHKLAGLRIDPTRPGTRQLTFCRSLSLLDIARGTTQPVRGLPDGAGIDVPVWSPDGNRFAFLRDLENGGIELWIGDASSAHCRPVDGIAIADMIAPAIQWRRDSRHVIVTSVPHEHGAPPVAPAAPTGPVVQEASGKSTKAPTYQDLLSSPHDDALFEHLATVQLLVVDTETDTVRPLGKPGIHASLAASPDEQFLLSIRLVPPFSWRVPYSHFAREIEILDATDGNMVRHVATLPAAEEIPPHGVPTGPRAVRWRPLHPARLIWTEALDGGDPLAKVPHRDRVLRLDVDQPDSAPEEWFRLEHRFSGWDWPNNPNEAIVTQYDRDRRWRTTFLQPETSDQPAKTLFDLSVNDAYNDPGGFVTELRPDGQRTLRQDGNRVWMAGRGATPEGDRPFLDQVDLASGDRVRLFTCGDDVFESFAGFTPDGSLLIARQSRTRPMNLFVRDPSGNERRLTDFADPHPEITGMHKEIVRYTREDGVPLSGTLVLPAGYNPETDGRLPLLFWAYPEEYSDAATAGQVRGSDRTFTRLAGTSPLWFATQGWAVLDNASVPVIGDPETMNDTFAEQITGAARAAIETLEQRGIIDPKRVVVAGHSYGAFMTANLLAAAPGLFAAGIARSGAYNRTLTPFGFQSERRSYWEAPDVYHRLSPFTHADKIVDPLLLIHGAEDNNPGTHTMQSERFYQALVAHGATVRLVLLPHESHGYQARESVLHVLHEMLDWADRFAGPKSARAGETSTAGTQRPTPDTAMERHS